MRANTSQVKKYNSGSTRQRVVRFMEDNQDIYLDHPANTKPLIDREDIAMFDYYKNDLSATCMKWTGLASFLLGGATIVIQQQIGRSRMTMFPYFLLLVPMVGGTSYHYYRFSGYIEFLEKKYRGKGLWDDNLWMYNSGKQEIPEGSLPKI